MKLSKFSFVMVGVLMMFKPVYAANHTIEFHTQNNTVNCSSDSDKADRVGCAIKGDLIKHQYQPTESCELDWG